MNPVYLEWLDHASVHGWVFPEQLDDSDGDAVLAPIRCYTFGFIVHETKEAVYVSHTWTSAGCCNDPLMILKPLITKRKVIRRPKKK